MELSCTARISLLACLAAAQPCCQGPPSPAGPTDGAAEGGAPDAPGEAGALPWPAGRVVDVSPVTGRCGAAPRRAPQRALRRPAVLFLNFDGATIVKGATSSAAGDQSPLCAGTFPAFDHRPFGPDRRQVLDAIATAVGELFSAYDLQVVQARPGRGPYDMALISGLKAGCGYPQGIAGLAPLDCDDAGPEDVVFVFGGGLSDLGWVALTAAHEVAHARGVPHSSEPCDVMSPVLCAAGSKRFLDTDAAVWPDHLGRCGLYTTNSHKLLSVVLGPG